MNDIRQVVETTGHVLFDMIVFNNIYEGAKYLFNLIPNLDNEILNSTANDIYITLTDVSYKIPFR